MALLYLKATVANRFLRTRIHLGVTSWKYICPCFPSSSLFQNFGSSVHISFTFSNNMSSPFTRTKSSLLFLQFIKTWLLFLTDWTDNGPVFNSSSSLVVNSYWVISDLGLAHTAIINDRKTKNSYKTTTNNNFAK